MQGVYTKWQVSATWWNLGRGCFTLADWNDPHEETEGREPVGGGKKPSVSDSNYYTSHEPGLLFSNDTFKQQTGEKKNSEWFISGASWDLWAGFGSGPKWDEEKTSRFQGNRSQPLKIFIGLFIDIFSGGVLSTDLFNGKDFWFPPRVLQPLIRPKNIKI